MWAASPQQNEKKPGPKDRAFFMGGSIENGLEVDIAGRFSQGQSRMAAITLSRISSSPVEGSKPT